MHLRQPIFTYSDCRSFTKNKELIQKFKETGDLRYFHKNKLGKICFQPVMVYGYFKDLPGKTTSDKVLRDKVLNIAKNLIYYRYQRGLASKICKFVDKKSALLAQSGTLAKRGKSASGGPFKSKIMPNQHPLDLATQQLAEELLKPIIRKFEKRKVHSSFIDNNWRVDLVDM